MERLSLRERQVVVLKEMGWSTQAIARELGLSPSTVATLFNRARTKGYQVVVVLPADALGILQEKGEAEEGGGRETGGSES